MDYNGLIPTFETPEQAVKFLHLRQARKCGTCKGKKEKNGNAFFCNSCLSKNEKKRKELKASQEFYAKNPQLIPESIRKQFGI